ncbi:rCG41494, isoform CRA_b [Rattus norvegicus]|uniref:RCG41494, isoform CRA_b n=1 Tax=Rattus norvegicus TaxID=10116 RepID=A6IHX4_RAT|nr:rCG41494, isoform CRA_b [Rattus norvegicus]
MGATCCPCCEGRPGTPPTRSCCTTVRSSCTQSAGYSVTVARCGRPTS